MLTRFAHTIWRASTDRLASIQDFAKRRTGSGMGYLYALTTTLAFFGLLPFAIGLAVVAPRSETFANEQLTVLQNWYPDALVLTLTGGILSTNADEPVVLDFPSEWDIGGDGAPAHAVIIDTNGSADDFAAYDTALLLTERAAVLQDDNGLRLFPYSEVDENIVVNEALITEITTSLSSFTPYLPWIAFGLVIALLVVLPFVLGGAVWAINLLFLLWATVILWLVALLTGRNLRYGELYRLGLFGLTNSLLLGFALRMTGLGAGWVPYVLFFGWMGYVLATFPKRTGMRAPLPPASVRTGTTAGRPAASTKKPAAKRQRTKKS